MTNQPSGPKDAGNMFVDEPQAESLVEFPVGQRLILILSHLNAHMHDYIQFHTGNIFGGKEKSSLPNV